MEPDFNIYHEIKQLNFTTIPFYTEDINQPNGLSDLLKIKVRFKIEQYFLKEEKTIKAYFYIDLLDKSVFVFANPTSENRKEFSCSFPLSPENEITFFNKEFEFRIKNKIAFNIIAPKRKIRLTTFVLNEESSHQEIISQITILKDYEVKKITA